METEQKNGKKKSLAVREETWARIDKRIGHKGNRTVDDVLAQLLDMAEMEETPAKPKEV